MNAADARAFIADHDLAEHVAKLTADAPELGPVQLQTCVQSSARTRRKPVPDRPPSKTTRTRPVPPAERSSRLDAASFDDDEALMRGYLDAFDGDVEAATINWREIRAQADAQLEREVEAARNWSPKVKVEPLTTWERRRFDRLLADGLAKKPTVGEARRRRDDATKGPEYAARAIEGEADAVAHAPNGLRNATLNTSAWTLARPELDGTVTADDIEDALVPAAIDAGLTEAEARSVVRGALRKRGKQ
jgi:hypothetical protein